MSLSWKCSGQVSCWLVQNWAKMDTFIQTNTQTNRDILSLTFDFDLWSNLVEAKDEVKWHRETKFDWTCKSSWGRTIVPIFFNGFISFSVLCDSFYRQNSDYQFFLLQLAFG